MLKLENISIKAGAKEIIKNISASFELGKNYAILGRNGSGKSSLSFAIAGNPKYSICDGKIFINSQDITNFSPDKKNEAGIFLSFQNIPEIPGIKLSEYLRTIYNFHKKSRDSEFKDLSPFLFKRFVTQFLIELNIPENFLDRDLNVGFSGGEKRKIELLQIKLLEPKYIILDEIDSGLDIDAFKIVSENLSRIKTKDNTLIFITHNFNLLDNFEIDEVIVLENGKIIDNGGNELIEKIKKIGYCNYCEINGNCDKEDKCE